MAECKFTVIYQLATKTYENRIIKSVFDKRQYCLHIKFNIPFEQSSCYVRLWPGNLVCTTQNNGSISVNTNNKIIRLFGTSYQP